MQYKDLKIGYILTIILLLGFSEPLVATNVKTSNWRQVGGMPSTRDTTSNSAFPAGNAALKKYAYAELLYQINYKPPTLSLVGKTIPPELITAVNTARSRSDALDLLGENGWELISVVTRNFDGGFELFFYFKKPID